jgi:protein TonB
VSENRYLLTLCTFLASSILVSSTLLVLQAATNWEFTPVSSETSGGNSDNSRSRYLHIQVKLVGSTNRMHEAAPLPEPTLSSSSSAEPIHTASITGGAELDAGIPASSSPESQPISPHRATSLTGVAGEATDKFPRTEGSPKEKSEGHIFTPALSPEAEARKQVEISDPTEPISDDVGGDSEEGTASVKHALDSGSNASSSKTSTPPAPPVESTEKPSAKAVASAAEKQQHRPPIPQAKPRWKPMSLAANQTPAQPSSKAKRLSAQSYNSKIWSAIARHKPRAGRRGSASVTFGIAANGRLGFVRVSRSSGDARLDKLAIATVRKAAPFPPPPVRLPSYTIRIYFH